MQRNIRSKSGFSLMELLATMVIMLFLMGIGIVSFYGIGQGDRLRGSVEQIRNTLALARQHAVTQSKDIKINFYSSGPTQSYDVVEMPSDPADTNIVVIREVSYLPAGVEFDQSAPPPPFLIFRPNGRVTYSGSTASPEIRLTEANNPGSLPISITVYTLTGLVSVE
jgi:prepilin-type N-terminal cleavage/methylation domain-containing protein